jgi:hypothetical protein
MIQEQIERIQDEFDMIPEYPFFPTEYRRHTLSAFWNVLLMFLILLYVVILALPALAAEPTPFSPTSINRSMPGARTGILTNAQESVVQINRDMYRLAPMALVEDKHGTPLSVHDLKWQDVEFRVQYWTANELGPNYITQLVINFPE